MAESLPMKELLESLIPAIDNIDGHCSVCIGSFVEAASKAIETTGFYYAAKSVEEGPGGDYEHWEDGVKLEQLPY